MESVHNLEMKINGEESDETDLSTDNDDVPRERMGGGGDILLTVEISGPHHQYFSRYHSNTGPLVPLHSLLQDKPGGQAHKYYHRPSQHLELGGAGEVEAEESHGRDQEVAEGRREEEEGGWGGSQVLTSTGDVIDQQTEALSQHHH